MLEMSFQNSYYNFRALKWLFIMEGNQNQQTILHVIYKTNFENSCFGFRLIFYMQGKLTNYS